MSDTKNLPQTVSSETAVQLHHGGSQRVGALIDSAMANLSREQVQVLSGKAADEALRLEVKIREQNIDYVNGKKLVEDHIDTFAMLDKQGRLTRQVVDSTIKTGAGEMRITSKSGATCFVATATYGDQDHPNVRFLRAWRDGYLAHRPAGVAFIGWYWRTGPKLATYVYRFPALKKFSRGALTVLVMAIRTVWTARRDEISMAIDNSAKESEILQS
ncbi:MAG: CFI-box-CTERM domain-containing protein [Pseudomonadota bacterium]